ncbi:hypothetical protein ACWFMI_27380 [Nocardiopsis terrae]
MKPRVTAVQVRQSPQWAALRLAYGLPPAPPPTPSRQQVRRRLAGIGLRRAAVDLEDDRYRWLR